MLILILLFIPAQSIKFENNKNINEKINNDNSNNNIQNYYTKLKPHEQFISHKSYETLSERSNSTSESTLFNPNTLSIYSNNQQINENGNNTNDVNQKPPSSLSSNSSRNNYEYNNNKCISKSYLSRPSSSLLNTIDNNEILSKKINNHLKLKPNPLANSVDPKIIQYNPNLLNYNKLLESESSSPHNIGLERKAFNNSIKDDIKAFIKTKKNLEKKI